ncbi:MAG: hypothetical protein AT715_01370 [Thermoproteus sp. JCHS_4]|nr:MAG: hypothetical protein AT715_01370 [Thermoproteus sp. JCHS_4]
MADQADFAGHAAGGVAFIKFDAGLHVFGIAMPDWRDGVIAVVKADESVRDAVAHVMSSCGVSTLNTAELPRYKLSCIEILLKKYKYESIIYITDIYGIVNRVALKSGVGRSALFEAAWAYLSRHICGGIDAAECDGETKLSCCRSSCGTLCELAKLEANMRRGVVVDLTKKLAEALGVSQHI